MFVLASCNHRMSDGIRQGQQYVCAGELVALQTMTNVLNYLKIEKIDIGKVRMTTHFWKILLTDLRISVDREVHCRAGEGDARRDC